MLTESQQQRTLRASVIDRFTLVATQPDQDTKFPVGPESAKKLGRGLWFKVQPYLIGLFTAKGIPMLWQGEEFGENYWVPPGGLGRVMLLRPVRWDYFYGDVGRSTVGLVRRLISLRRQTPELRNGDHFFYNDWGRYQSRGLLLFSRSRADQFTLVALNFSDADQIVSFWFPTSGDYRELIHGSANDQLTSVAANTEISLHIPSNYGRVWRKS
jgi:maltooligosyltrehalose trehalohydrolase